MDKDTLCGQMEESTRDNGMTTRSKEKVSTFGLMDRCMTANSRMTIAMASEFYIIQMVNDLKDNGVKEKNTDQVHTFSQTKPSTWLSIDMVKR
jgi:hypothetical protein